MIVAVAIVHMMQPAIDQKIDMIAMRHRLVPATGTVDMATCRRRDAAIRVGDADGDHMFIDMIAVHMVQMAVVQIINMAIMLHGGVAAAGTMLVGVIGVGVAGHGQAPCKGGSIAGQCKHFEAIAGARPVNSRQWDVIASLDVI